VIENAGTNLGTEAARRLAHAGSCELEPGLSEAEFSRIETAFGFMFSADHRAFLSAGLPVASPPEDGATWDQPWPDWRHGDLHGLRDRLQWPVQGVLDSVEEGWWEPAWGSRPHHASAAMSAARRELARVPTLVPLYAHRFLPAGQGSYGHPVLSVWGTDIICYGHDLADYVDREFGTFDENAPWPSHASVPFWSDFLG
jgi:hypothetical protein